jgi:hypothetical protein
VVVRVGVIKMMMMVSELINAAILAIFQRWNTNIPMSTNALMIHVTEGIRYCFYSK